MSSDFAKHAKIDADEQFGHRFMRAFSEGAETADKKKIAEMLGYKSDKAIYKIINGEQEMGFEHLRRFREVTDHTIDWLLVPDEPLEKDGWVNIRMLLQYGPWLNDIESLRRKENEENNTDLSFEEFLAEMIRRGYSSTFSSERELSRIIREMVLDVIEDRELERTFQKAAKESLHRPDDVGPMQPVSNSDVMIVPNLGKVDGGEEEEGLRKTG